jgi:hypothetical protein
MCGARVLPPLHCSNTHCLCVSYGCHGKPWFFCSQNGVNRFVLMGLQCGFCGSDFLRSSGGLGSGRRRQVIVCSFCVSVCEWVCVCVCVWVCITLLSLLSCAHDFTVTICTLKSQSVVIKLQQHRAAVQSLEVSRSHRSWISAVQFFSVAKPFQLLVAVYRSRLIGNNCGFSSMSFKNLRGRISLKMFVVLCSLRCQAW